MRWKVSKKILGVFLEHVMPCDHFLPSAESEGNDDLGIPVSASLLVGTSPATRVRTRTHGSQEPGTEGLGKQGEFFCWLSVPEPGAQNEKAMCCCKCAPMLKCTGRRSGPSQVPGRAVGQASVA